jgi:hypothetical protein
MEDIPAGDLALDEITATLTDTAAWIATATTSALIGISTGIVGDAGDVDIGGAGDLSGIGVGGSETISGGTNDGNPLLVRLAKPAECSPVQNFILGLVIVLIASFANALGVRSVCCTRTD